MHMPKRILIILLLAGTFAVRTGHAGHPPYSGFSVQIYSTGPGYYYPPPRHYHYHHHYYYPRYWRGHGHFDFPGPGYYAPPRYRYGYYPPGLNINWRGYRCD